VHARKLRYEPLNFTGPGLKVSDVLLADSVLALDEDDLVVREEAYVWVNPSGYFETGLSPTVYFEVYDLAMDARGRTRYRISYSLSDRRGRVTSLTPSEVEGSLASTVEYVILDVTDLRSGPYELTVTVEDLLAGTEVSRSRSLVLGRSL